MGSIIIRVGKESIKGIPEILKIVLDKLPTNSKISRITLPHFGDFEYESDMTIIYIEQTTE